MINYSRLSFSPILCFGRSLGLRLPPCLPAFGCSVIPLIKLYKCAWSNYIKPMLFHHNNTGVYTTAELIFKRKSCDSRAYTLLYSATILSLLIFDASDQSLLVKTPPPPTPSFPWKNDRQSAILEQSGSVLCCFSTASQVLIEAVAEFCAFRTCQIHLLCFEHEKGSRKQIILEAREVVGRGEGKRGGSSDGRLGKGWVQIYTLLPGCVASCVRQTSEHTIRACKLQRRLLAMQSSYLSY